MLYNAKLFSFARWGGDQKLIVFSNFSDQDIFNGNLHITEYVIQQWNLRDGTYQLKDELYGKTTTTMQITNGEGLIEISLQPLESLVLSLQ